jgi:hypothetical protein
MGNPDAPERQAWEDKDAARSLLEEANARIRQAETFAWAVPGLAITAEAFLLGAALSKTTTPKQQVVACFAGIVILLAALHFLAKHAFNFRVYEAVIERSRETLGYPFVSMRALVGSPTPSKESNGERERIDHIRESFPRHVDLVRAGWLDHRATGGQQPPTPYDAFIQNAKVWVWRPPRNFVARRLPAVRVWTLTILVLIGLDIAVLVRALTRAF